MSTTYKAAVAQTLVSNAKNWIDTHTINTVGGPGGTRRLRELRSEGWSIRTRRNPATPTQFQFMLTRVPAKKVIAQYV